ncbi:MAG: ABC transporter permease, partial [Candidatus Adiutrix sp.]
MSFFFDSLFSAFKMIFSFDAQLWQVVSLSLKVTFGACLLASVVGLPIAYILAHRDFWGKRFIVLLLNTLQSVPTVVVGLFLYTFISRRGIFGPLDLLYTPMAISIGQFFLILP